MSLTPEMAAIFEEAAADEKHPLAAALEVLLRELNDARPKHKDDKAELFHTRRRRLRGGITRAFLTMARDETLDYNAQLVMVRQLLVALMHYDNGKTGGIL